jgi:hypothetical protein
MPTLLPTVWTAVNPAVPYVWSCSECRAVFDMGPVHVSPGQKQIDQVNLQFEAHCRHVHAGSLPINHLGNTPSAHGTALKALWSKFQQAPGARLQLPPK